MDNNDLKMSERCLVAAVSNKMYDAISLRQKTEDMYFEMQYFNAMRATLYSYSTKYTAWRSNILLESFVPLTSRHSCGNLSFIYNYNRIRRRDKSRYRGSRRDNTCIVGTTIQLPQLKLDSKLDSKLDTRRISRVSLPEHSRFVTPKRFYRNESFQSDYPRELRNPQLYNCILQRIRFTAFAVFSRCQSFSTILKSFFSFKRFVHTKYFTHI